MSNQYCIYNFNPGPFRKGAESSNGHLAFDGNSKLSIKFILYLSIPAQAIIAALSLHRFVGGKIESLGADAVEAEMTDLDVDWLKRKLKVAEIGSDFDLSKMTKVVAGKKLWNYDALEPSEKKGAI